MRGPKVMAVALVAFFGSSILAVQLMSQSGSTATVPWATPPATPGAPAAPSRAPGTPAAPSRAPVAPIVVAPLPLAPPPGPEDGSGEESMPLSLNLGVAPVPPVAVSRERELKLNDCVERKVREGGRAEAKPVLPGRWPALKRAREAKRLQRFEARAACERELAG